jgi:hypothetical protein
VLEKGIGYGDNHIYQVVAGDVTGNGYPEIVMLHCLEDKNCV